MDRTVSPAGMPGSIALQDPPVSVTADFPDLQKPKKGPWTVTVPVSTDSHCPVQILVELIQVTKEKGTVVLASQTCGASTEESNCVLTISDTSESQKGVCNLSGLKIRLTPTEHCSSSSSSSSSSGSSDSSDSSDSSSTPESSSSSGSSTFDNCCSGVTLPDTLTLTISGCYSDTITLTRGPFESAWSGADSHGDIWYFSCTSMVFWEVYGGRCNFHQRPYVPVTGSCSPFYMTSPGTMTPESQTGCGTCSPVGDVTVEVTA